MVAWLIGGAVLLPVVYDWLFPLRKPNLKGYFAPGHTFEGKAEGITQTVLRQEGDRVYGLVKFAPRAPGPPEHLHVAMDEIGTVQKGTLTARINGQVYRFGPGERFVLPRGAYHSIYNETDEEVVLGAEPGQESYLPAEFLYSLEKVYPMMDRGGGAGWRAIMQIAVLDEVFDMCPAGPPVPVFRVMKKVLKPYARLLGFSPYDAKSKPG